MPRAGCTTPATGCSTRTCLPTFAQVRPCCASIQVPSSLTRLLKPHLAPSRSAFLPHAICLPFAPALCLCLPALCTCPLSLSLSACPLHLPHATSACPLRLPFVSLCLPFAPALCLFLLALCTCPVSPSASAITWAPMVSVLLLTFAILQSTGALIYSDDQCLVACQHVSTWAPGIFASCIRPEFVAVALKLASRLAFQKPFASWFIRIGGSSDNVVLCSILCWSLSQSAALAACAAWAQWQLLSNHLTNTYAVQSLIMSRKALLSSSSLLLLLLLLLLLSRACSCS